MKRLGHIVIDIIGHLCNDGLLPWLLPRPGSFAGTRYITSLRKWPIPYTYLAFKQFQLVLQLLNGIFVLLNLNTKNRTLKVSMK